MWLILIVFVALVVISLRLCAGWLVSWGLARLLGCRQVKIGRVGMLKLSYLKLVFSDQLILELDQLCISSSFFNQEYSKPLIVSIGDIRFEVGPALHDAPILGQRLSSSEQQSQPNEKRMASILNWSQYVAAELKTARIVVLDWAVPGCMLHLSMEQIFLDTFRDHDGIQVELCSKMINAKLLKRSRVDQASFPSHIHSIPLLDLSLDLFLAVGFQWRTGLLKKLSLKLSDPYVSASEEIIDYVRKTKTTSKKPNSETETAERQFPDLNIDVGNFSLRFMPLSGTRSLVAHIKTFGCHTHGLETLDCSCSDLSLADGIGSSIKLTNFSSTMKKTADCQRKLEIEAAEPVLNFCEDDLVWWASYAKSRRSQSSAPKSSGGLPTNLSLSVEVTNLRCALQPTAAESVEFGVQLLTLATQDKCKRFEFGIETLWCCKLSGDQKHAVEDVDSFMYRWGAPLYIGAILVQSTSGRLQVQLDQCKLEWEAAFADRLLSLALRLIGPTDSKASVQPMPEKPKPTVTVCATDVALVLPVKKTVYTLCHTSKIRLEVGAVQRHLLVTELTLIYDKINKSELLKLSNYDGERRACIHKLTVTQRPQPNEVLVQVSQSCEFIWSPELHLSLFETFSTSMDVLKILKKDESPPETQTQKPPLSIAVVTDGLKLEIRLPKNHLMNFAAPSLRLQSASGVLDAVAPNFSVIFDSNKIFDIKKFHVQRLGSHPELVESRKAFKDLTTPDNRVVCLAADRVDVLFPFGYDFAAAYEEAINMFKWVKLVHKIKKKEFTADSPLPPDLMFIVKEVSLQLLDDLFEVRLRNNYELLVDEAYECIRRKQMLDEKLEDLRHSHPLLPRGKVKELHKTLLQKNSDIYIQRSKQMPQPRLQLIDMTLENIAIRALADKSLHGENNVIRLMRSYNAESPYPSEGVEFITLWARGVELDMESCRMEFRDYPQPYLLLKDAHFWGKLVGAEQTGVERSLRSCAVALNAPWPTFTVTRNMFPLKFYYDLSCEIDELNVAYGPCWEPCLAHISLCWNQISQPSKDPSLPLPFWDKMRLLFHGRLSMLCRQLISTLLASTDPYNTTEQLELSWDNFGFDWTNGLILMQSDLDAYVRTASKYDDIRLLHLPNLKLSVRMLWVCMGDRNDHHVVTPCAPDKLPQYTGNQEHDSYRAFRSRNLDLALNVEVKAPQETSSDSNCPQLLLYSNTFRWLDTLKNTLSAVNRPIRRGKLFHSRRAQKQQLFRHYKHVQLSFTLPRFLISYWMSFSSQHGFRLSCRSLQLMSSLELSVTKPTAESVSRRPLVSWTVGHMSAELLNAQIHLFGSKQESSSNSNFFIGLGRLSYARDGDAQKSYGDAEIDADRPVHRLTVHDLRGAWTSENRDTILAVLDGIQRARLLRRNLSTDALKLMQFAEERPRSNSMHKAGRIDASSPPRSRSRSTEGAHAVDMLQQLIDEANTKFVAYSEETTDLPTDFLKGVAMCETNDVILTRWQIELINSQVALKGCETGGFVLCTAARASVTQRVHRPVWRETQLLGKRSWVALLSGMQYYAPTLGKGSVLRWLPKHMIEEQSCSDPNIDSINTYISASQAVGGVVPDDTSSDMGDYQLQRVISRCSCQMYFCYFSDTFDLEDTERLPPPPEEDYQYDLWLKKEYVDCFTLKHNMLEVSTNPQQYAMIIDIVNHLLLFVDPKKKESEEKRQRLRFKFLVQNMDEMRTSILYQQNRVRDFVAKLRSLERQAFYLGKELSEKKNDPELLAANTQLADEMNSHKEKLALESDELSFTIGCFKEKQVRQVKQTMPLTDEQLAPIVRRFEVCFEDCTWRLTETDGQLGLADLQIRNFLYTRTSRINNSGEHLLEIGTVKVTNLLPNSRYRDTLQPQQQSTLCAERQPAVRVICRDMAPVGGIMVKEHFEVNVIPMVVQMTYSFFRTMMKYFFPGRNIDKEDVQSLDASDEQTVSLTASKAASLASKGKGVRKKERALPSDEIEKMKQRAEKNNMFLYIKIPEVPFLVSYKGEKEKNIEDVENFQLRFPLVEYHDRNWTWLDMALAIKHCCKRVLLQQFMKEKLRLRNRIMGAPDRPEPSAMAEEDKVRLVLGKLGVSHWSAAMAENSVHQTNGSEMENTEPVDNKPFLELYVKASGIDSRRIGACLFCQEFWMELYALYELGLVRVEVKTVNINSEPFKRNFLGAQPPVLVEREKGMTYTDNRELEGRIFHIAKEFQVPLFEKDVTVEKKIETLYRNFKLFMHARTDFDKQHNKGKTPECSDDVPGPVQPSHNKLIEQLANINQLLEQRGTRYLLGSSMTEYDCELMPRLHHIRIAGQQLCGLEIPYNLTFLWNYILTAYRTAAFIESCPADQDIIHHYKEQFSLLFRQRESLQIPTKTHTIPDDVLGEIKRLGLDKN